MDIADFTYYLKDLSATTILNHNRNIRRLNEMINILDEPKINIKILYKQEKRIPTLMSLYKTLMKYLNYININPTEYNDEYIKIKTKYDDIKKKDTRELLYNNVYDVVDLYNKMYEFYKNKNYTGYVISYILLIYNLRNQDINMVILKKNYDLTDRENEVNYNMNDKTNYIIIYKSMVKLYINVYKTSKVYGIKEFHIKDYKFIKSINSIYETRHTLLENNKNLTNEIIKHTPYNLSEIEILKILLKHNNSIEYYKNVSQNRGTDYDTLVKSYSIL